MLRKEVATIETVRHRMSSKLLFAWALIGLVALPAGAQNPPESTPTRIRGTVEKLDGQNLTVKSRDGAEVTIILAPNFTVSFLVKKTLTDVKAGDYVASTSVKGADGRLHAKEVRIFPEARRGVAEGQSAWDLLPDSVMTNATVSGITGAPQGQTMKVTYKGGESEIVVDAETPVFGYGAGDASLLKPGTAIFTVAQKKPDGSISAGAVTAEKDGIKPPM
jgi:hypothetical protein